MEHSRFFDSVNGDRVYPASSFSEFFASIIGTGVQSLGINLQVIEVPGTMQIEIQPGVAWINGYFYMVDADKLQLSIDGADPNDLRYDRIVLRWDLQNRELTVKVLKGIPDVSPVIPTLTRTESIYEISLAKIDVIAGKSYLEQNQITDERSDATACGKAELLVMVEGFNPDDYGSAGDVEANTQAIGTNTQAIGTNTQDICDLLDGTQKAADSSKVDGKKISVSITEPASPSEGDIWIDTSV